MLMEHVWLQQQKQIYRLRNVRAGYVLYRALVISSIYNANTALYTIFLKPGDL